MSGLLICGGVLVTTVDDVVSIKGLEYKGELVGLRIFFPNGAWDIGKFDVKGLGFKHFDIAERIQLQEVGELLLSEEEAETGEYAVDVSDDESAMYDARGILDSDRFRDHLKGFQPPHRVSLNELLSDDGWKPKRVDRTDEHKNQHTLTQPNGKDWSGGWIGSAKSLESAMKGFHFNQVMYALHKGAIVADIAVETYQHLKQAKEIIELIESRTYIKDNIVAVMVNGEPKYFSVDAFPFSNRVEQRGFVRNNDLVGDDIPDASQDSWFTAIEMTCIGITKAYYREGLGN
jgi:hypothetical protein